MENTLPYIIYILFIIIYNIYTYIYTNREKRKVGKELIKIFQTESCVWELMGIDGIHFH